MSPVRKATDKAEKKTLSDVRKYGLHVINVLEDENGPGFSYSIGLFENYGHPEIIIIGLRQDLAHTLLNNMAYDIKEGEAFNSGQYYDSVLDGYHCYFGKVSKSHYKDYVGWALWFYQGTDFPLVQCVYPTVSGKFPWDEDFPEDARWHCQLLTRVPNKKNQKTSGAR